MGKPYCERTGTFISTVRAELEGCGQGEPWLEPDFESAVATNNRVRSPPSGNSRGPLWVEKAMA